MSLDEIQRHHSRLCKHILLVISVLTPLHMPLHCVQSEVMKFARGLEYIFEQDSYRKIPMDRGSEFVNPHVKKVLLKYNTTLNHSHSPIKAALTETFVRTLQIFNLKIWQLTHTQIKQYT